MSIPDNCGGSSTKTVSIKVDAPPTATFANASAAYCGAQTLTFNNTSSATTQKVTYGGTADPATATYQWTITPLGGAAAATFISPTSATSANPKINFPGVGSYTVTVTQTNSCGTSIINAASTQTITIQQAPSVIADPNPNETICAATGSFQTAGSISDMTNVTSYKWTSSGNGTFDFPTTSLTPIYHLGTNDVNGTTLTITLEVKTNLVGACGDIIQSFNLIIIPTDRITSNNTQSVCSGNTPGYQITASSANSSFTWTSALTSGLATGFNQQSTPVNSTNAVITDILTNNSSTNDAMVTYTITPTSSNGCPGTPFTYTVTVNPLPVLSPIGPLNICSGNPAGITFTDHTLKYIWSSSVTSGSVSGNTQHGAASSVTGINEVLTNTGTTPATVTYTITPVSASGCAGGPITVIVSVNLATTIANAGTPTAICSETSYILSGNTPTVGAGKWTEAHTMPVSFDNDTDPTTTVRNLVPGTIYNFVWTITSPCGSTASSVVVTDYAPPVGGTATTASPICSGSNGVITLGGQTGNVIRWEQSLDGVNFTTIPGTNTGTTYNYTNLTQTTTFRAVVMSGVCTTPAFSGPVTVTVNPTTPAATITGGSQVLCNQPNAVLNGNLPAGTTGKWALTSGQTGITFDDDTSPNVTISGLAGGQTYIFSWTLTGAATCPTTGAFITVNDLAPIGNNNILSPADGSLVCAGSAITLTASLPTGGNNIYTYQWQSSTDNGANWADITGQTSQNATITMGAQNTAYRRIVKSGTCNDAGVPVTIDIEAAIGNNTLPISSEICYNTIPGTITGSQPTGGDNISYTYQWQQSTNANTGYTDIAGATGINFTPTQQLTITTYYRRIVSSAACSGATSNISLPIKVIVDPLIKADFSAQVTGGCTPFNLNKLVNGSNNITVVADPNITTYTWSDNNGIISQSSNPAFPGYSLNTDGQSVTITLTVNNAFGCQDSKSITFNAISRVTAGFTMADVSANPSGTQTYQFSNTSAPANSATYLWDFGDGTTSTDASPNHVFAADDANGTDKIYEVKLTARTDCSVDPVSQQITVYPSTPHAIIDPGILTGCAPYTITARNLSPGTNASYTFYLYDGASLVQQITKTDKSDVSFASLSPNNTKTYTLYMVATNIFGVTGQSISYPITVNPSNITANMTVLGSAADAVGCVPFNVTFQNLSNGGNSYVYNIYDSNQNPVHYVTANDTRERNYEFDTPGTYYVDLSVISSCTTAESPSKIKIIVAPLPAPDFTTTAPENCSQSIVSFTNTTPDGSATAPANSYTYDWDFGDGTHSSDYTPPPHTYDYTHSPYTVTLNAITANGCSASTTKTITVNGPAGTDFTARPDTIINIPNYHFSFVDQSTGNSVSWNWDFGDGSTSTDRNPEHTYADTGRYKVTLVTTTAAGCSGTKSHFAVIGGVPGQLYVPNAFMPTSLNTELRVFTVKGSGIKRWDMRVYNSWGGLLFETTKLNSKGEPMEFWDGTFKGQEMQQGGYAWEISATFINGTDWRGMSYKGSAPKKAGIVNLIR